MLIPPALRSNIDAFHAARIAALLAPLRHGSGVAMPAERIIFLCFTNRCGSNYLGQLLAATGQFNEAGEYLNAETVIHHASRLADPSLRAYFARLPGMVARHGWLAMKAGIDQLVMLSDAGILREVHARAHYILLERRDRLGQAISRCIAAQTGRWTSEHASDVPDSALRYSRAAIAQEMRSIEEATYGFYSFFAANRIAPLHLMHEDVLADPATALARIGAALGLGALRVDPSGVRIARQANAVNAAWRDRFLAGD